MTTALVRVGYAQTKLDFNDLAILPRAMVADTRGLSELSLMWSVLKWGLPPRQFAKLDDMRMTDIRARFRQWEKDCQITMVEIVGLMAAIEKHSMEIEYDLIVKGLRLRNFPSPECTWRDLLVILRMSGSHDRFYRAANPDGAQWDLTNLLIAEAVDSIRWLQWAKTEAAKDVSTMPKPITRPGVAADKDGENGIKGRRMPMERAKERFDRPDPDRQKKLYELFRK